MSNKNYQDIINRIYEIYKELGISAGDSNNTPSEDSIKSTAEKILNNLILNPANSVGESIEVIKNKVLQIKSNTESVNNYLAPLKQKFDNIYNELNSTSSSYMKGKVNGIYSTVLDIYNILFSTGSGSIEQSLENLKEGGKFTYYGDTTLTLKPFTEYHQYFIHVAETQRTTIDERNEGVYIARPSSSLNLPEKDKYIYDFRFKENKTIIEYHNFSYNGAPPHRVVNKRYLDDDKGRFELYIPFDEQEYSEKFRLTTITGSDTWAGIYSIEYNYLRDYMVIYCPNDTKFYNTVRPLVIFDYVTKFENVEVYRKRGSRW